MASDHSIITVPRISPNDDTIALVEWLKPEGEHVEKDEEFCVLESSKAAFEMPAPRSGWLFHIQEKGQDLLVGRPLAVIADSRERPDIPVPQAPQGTDAKITEKARKLMEAHGVDASEFSQLDIVRERHVRAFLDARGAEAPSAPDGRLTPLTPVQRRAARVVTKSAQTIPHSYLVRWVNAEEAEGRVAALAEEEDIMLSLSDWLVACVAKSVTDHSKVNASWREDGIFVHARTHVGFALNLESGDLVVPVIRDADQMELNALVGRIRKFQIRSIRGRLSVEDLGAGTITVTSLVGSGAHQVFPIIVPDQSAIVAIGDRVELGPSEGYFLCMAFDHRVLNGTEAAAFLDRVARELTQGGQHD